MTRGSKIGPAQVEEEPRMVGVRRCAPRAMPGRKVEIRPVEPHAHGTALLDSDLRALARIDAALERIESGRYGYCLRCGEPIGGARLEADPALAFCLACEGQD
jgi:hypothetical protein